MDLEKKLAFIYHSNQLAEITFSLDQTRQILEGDGDPHEEWTAPDGEVFPISVVLNHWKALNFVLSFPAHRSLDVRTICQLHARLMEGEILSYGEFRECDPRLVGIRPFPYQQIPQALEKFCQFVKESLETPPADKDLLAWQVHHEFSLIHPFIDGNGRMARLLYTFIRSRFAMPLEIISHEDKAYYYKSIQDYQKHKLRQLSHEST